MRILETIWTSAWQLVFDADSIQLSPGGPPSCPANPPLSCSNTQAFGSDSLDTCCSIHPGGQLVQTQFWNSDALRGPPGYLGPKSSWTIHGLWPDHCDGRYDSVCDCQRSGDCSSSNYKCRLQPCNRGYANISQVMDKFKEYELLEFMRSHWKGISSDEGLHQHEWSKHGTCISTLEPKCYSDYVAAQEVVDYFRIAVDLYKSLPTHKVDWQWLEEAGIVPSSIRTYSRKDILQALEYPRGASPVVGCQGSELREVWYFFNVRGSLQAGQFTATDPDFSGVGGHPGKSCPDTIRYLPKDE